LKKLGSLIAGLVWLSSAALAQEVRPLAIANGESISLQEIEKAAEPDLKELELRRSQLEVELERDRQSIIEKTVEKVMNDRILAAEGKKRNISAEDLIALEVDSVSPAPSDEAVVKFYNENKEGLEGSLGDNAAAIREYLRNEKRLAAFTTLITRLRKEYGAKSYFEPSRTPIVIDGRPSKGPAEAPVTVVEFSDFQCPYCGAFFPTLRQIAADYKDSVRVVYMQFPLASIHPEAEKAAEAALCANEQGKFWEFHDVMFGDQTKLKVADLKRSAKELSLDAAAFDACLESGRHFAAIREDVTQGVRVGVSGTPAMFINGRVLVGNHTYADIQKIIEEELLRTAAAAP